MNALTRTSLFSFMLIAIGTYLLFPWHVLAAEGKTKPKNAVEYRFDWEDVTLENTNTTPDETRLAITTLLGASNKLLPRNESCDGFWSSDISQPSRVKHLVSSALSAFDTGENRVFGKCENDRCVIEFGHKNDDDVFHARIRFRTHNGKIIISTLDCFSTP